MTNLALQRLIKRIGHTFVDTDLLVLALTHRSCGSSNNERLEFLGDSILNFTIAETLFRRFPTAREGQLSRLRSQLVKGETLAEIARELVLGDSLILGEGELKSGGHRRDSILADTVEAIIGAIYLDAGMDACQKHLLAWYQSRLQELSLDTNPKDPKTQLQEYLQAQKAPLPKYSVVAVSGEAHAQAFTVECRVTLLQQPTVARAGSRRAAEKQAALSALQKLQGSVSAP
ncbi:ribonuclease III [Exilibacterium tricleocarpae]|uniref:Ribonuclease 3 n=1 Tax=Exilibacterium tricleocarpae TaxID=2591008 RepID=A0A545U3K2_9GAMM|nr:ribonuclease III [Exilibacterium tricleocarpae]TQV84052.1 ribonuclease III [Exilibacterium tricleocarpae]